MLSSNERGTNGGGRIPLSNIVAGLPPLRTLKAASVGRRSRFYRSGTVSEVLGSSGAIGDTTCKIEILIKFVSKDKFDLHADPVRYHGGYIIIHE